MPYPSVTDKEPSFSNKVIRVCWVNKGSIFLSFYGNNKCFTQIEFSKFAQMRVTLQTTGRISCYYKCVCLYGPYSMLTYLPNKAKM